MRIITLAFFLQILIPVLNNVLKKLFKLVINTSAGYFTHWYKNTTKIIHYILIFRCIDAPMAGIFWYLYKNIISLNVGQPRNLSKDTFHSLQYPFARFVVKEILFLLLHAISYHKIHHQSILNFKHPSICLNNLNIKKSGWPKYHSVGHAH